MKFEYNDGGSTTLTLGDIGNLNITEIDGAEPVSQGLVHLDRWFLPPSTPPLHMNILCDDYHPTARDQESSISPHPGQVDPPSLYSNFTAESSLSDHRGIHGNFLYHPAA